MKPQRCTHFTCKRIRALIVIVLCVGLLAVALFQVARVANPSIRNSIWKAAINEHKSPWIVLRWQFASAHSNLTYLADDFQRRVAAEESVGLLVARSATPTLAFILPLLGLFAGLALQRYTQPSSLSSHVHARQRLFWIGLLSAAVLLLIGGFLVLETHILEASFDWSQWCRLLVWLLVLGVYFSSFTFAGSWISQRVNKDKTIVWIILSLFVALFILQASREPLMRVDGSLLPNIPQLPAEVRMSLFRPSGTPQVIPEREEMIAEYLASVDAYSESIHCLAAHQYNLERWWHVACPPLLLSEISGQLLQTQFNNIVDVVFSEQGSNRRPSLASSLVCVWPEVAWLCLIMGCVAWAATRKRGAGQ